MKKSEFGRNKAEQCAKEIIDYLIKNNLWGDTNVYANGRCFSNKSEDGHYHYDSTWDNVFVEENKNPKDYFDYAGDFLSMSFEGDFYNVINCYCSYEYCDKIMNGFNEICKKYGKYYELYDAWNLSLFDM